MEKEWKYLLIISIISTLHILAVSLHYTAISRCRFPHRSGRGQCRRVLVVEAKEWDDILDVTDKGFGEESSATGYLRALIVPVFSVVHGVELLLRDLKWTGRFPSSFQGRIRFWPKFSEIKTQKEKMHCKRFFLYKTKN